MSPMANEELRGVLEQKKEWLLKMHDLTEQCGLMLQSDDVDAFSASIEAREGIISKIDAFSKMEKQLPDSDDAQILVLKQEIRGIILKIMQLDEQNALLAQSKIERYKAELKDLNQSKKGISMYKNAYLKNDAYYFDEKK